MKSFNNSHVLAVVALYHGDGRFQQTEARQFSLRPLAVKTALDTILAHPDFAAHIDPTRIGGLGESFGGATMMSLLGAKSVYLNGPSIIANVPAITTVDPRIKAAATIFSRCLYQRGCGSHHHIESTTICQRRWCRQSGIGD